MNSRYLTFLILLFIFSCQKKNETQSIKSNLSAQEIFNKSCEAHGLDTFLRSQIRFELSKTHFSLKEENGRAVYSMIRTKDEQEFKALYDGGHLTYYIDDKLQDDGSYPYQILLKTIYGFSYTYMIPFTLRGNDAQASRTDDVTIRGEKYHVLNIKIPNTGQILEDRYILYVHTKTYKIGYTAIQSNQLTPTIQFRRNTNARDVRGILFQDYIPFTFIDEPHDLANMYELYNTAKLKVLKEVKIENIEVVPKE